MTVSAVPKSAAPKDVKLDVVVDGVELHLENKDGRVTFHVSMDAKVAARLSTSLEAALPLFAPIFMQYAQTITAPKPAAKTSKRPK